MGEQKTTIMLTIRTNAMERQLGSVFKIGRCRFPKSLPRSLRSAVKKLAPDFTNIVPAGNLCIAERANGLQEFFQDFWFDGSVINQFWAAIRAGEFDFNRHISSLSRHNRAPKSKPLALAEKRETKAPVA